MNLKFKWVFLTYLQWQFMNVFGADHLLEGIYCGKVNCYDVLGITREATKNEIGKSYRQLAKKFHPDLHRGVEEKKAAEEKFKEIATFFSFRLSENTVFSLVFRGLCACLRLPGHARAAKCLRSLCELLHIFDDKGATEHHWSAVYEIIEENLLHELAVSQGQDLKKIKFKDQSWLGLKTRSRDATLSRHKGININELALHTKIAVTPSAFARPEVVVYREVAALKNLPKLGNDLKELPIFCNRIQHIQGTGVVVTYAACCLEKVIAGGMVPAPALVSHAPALLHALFQVLGQHHDRGEHNKYVMKGHLLVSGSDDTNVVVWNWAKNIPLQTIKTGHKSNVFQSKFLYLNAESQPILGTGFLHDGDSWACLRRKNLKPP